jgi:hypothetical protein
MKSWLDLGFVAQPRNRPPTSSCCSCHHAARTRPRWPPGPSNEATFLLHTWRPHRQRPFALVLHLYQHKSSRNLHLQYLAKNQSTQRCQSLITQGSDHPPVLEPHMVLSVIWAARDERHPWVNSPKSNSRSRSPESLHGSAQDFGDSRNTS